MADEQPRLVFVDSFLFAVLLIWVIQAIFGSAGTEYYPIAYASPMLHLVP